MTRELPVGLAPGWTPWAPASVARPDSPAELEASARRSARGLESEGAAATVVAGSTCGKMLGSLGYQKWLKRWCYSYGLWMFMVDTTIVDGVKKTNKSNVSLCGKLTVCDFMQSSTLRTLQYFWHLGKHKMRVILHVFCILPVFSEVKLHFFMFWGVRKTSFFFNKMLFFLGSVTFELARVSFFLIHLSRLSSFPAATDRWVTWDCVNLHCLCSLR